MTHHEEETHRLPSQGDSAPPISYRCVCSEVISLDSNSGGTCQACGRNYHARVLRTLDTHSFSASTAPLPMESGQEGDRIGQRFGHYQIMRRLGIGGMGEVYQALDESLQRYVALKVIRPQATPIIDQSDDETDQLMQEAIAQARLNHPNVAHIYYVGREGDSPFLAMELVGGATLADRLRKGPLSFDHAIDIALQVISALQHAGSFDIVHGDIKPSNLLMADEGVVKLSDFGLARRMSTNNGTESINGSPNYISPEGCRGDPTDVRSDMYSLGVLLFEMTFHRLPYIFDGSGIMERLAAHQHKPVEFPSQWPRQVPKRLKQVLEKLLAKEPDDRYQYYGELRSDLLRMKPASSPRASAVQRGAAWFADLAWVIGAQQLVFAIPWNSWAVTAAGPAPTDKAGPGALVECLLVMIPVLLFCLLQTFWTSPGKYLFRIRIADRLGGRHPSRRLLLGRSLWQMSPVWVATLAACFAICENHDPFWLQMLGIALGIPLAADILWMVFHRRCTSLHDMVFGTRVVLDLPDFDAADAADQKQFEEDEYWERKYWSPLKRTVSKIRDSSKPSGLV